MPAPHHSVFTGQMPFLPPNQQRQSTEGKNGKQCKKCQVRKTNEKGPVRAKARRGEMLAPEMADIQSKM